LPDEIEHALSPQRHLDRLNAPLVVAYGYNHFEMPEILANPYGLLGRAALAQMKLSSA
jgi:arylformamidase